MKVNLRKLAATFPARAGISPALADASRTLARVLASPVVRAELLPLGFITFVAAVLRLLDLMEVPPGFHGDEGLAGMDALRITREGWIGPYLSSALGTTSGAFYWTAAVFRIFGESPFTVRLSFAILGVATIPLTYLTFRLMFDRRIAILASALLAVMSWHIHFSRVAFVPVTWPLMEMATLSLLFAGFRTGRWPFFALAGLAFGGGLYGYLIYPIFMVALAVYLLLVMLTAYRRRLLEFARYMAPFALCTVLIALPLIQFARDPDSLYWDRFRTYSITKSPEYQAADGLIGKAEFFAGRARTFFRGFVASPPIDYADATGIKPILDRLSPVLMVAGLVIAFSRWRRHEYLLPILMLIIVPAAALSSQDGMYRRTLGLAPFLALLAALPLALVWEQVERIKDWQLRSASYTLIGGVVAVVALFNFHLYFDTMRNEEQSKWVFAREIAAASQYLRHLDEEPYVYFYSARWSFNYETRQYLAPGVQGEDRSQEFGPDHAFSLEGIDRSRESVLLFLPPYQPNVNEAMAQYPGGAPVVRVDPDGAVLFVAYHLPPAAATAPPAAPAP